MYVHSSTVRQPHYIEKQTQTYKKIGTSSELRVWKLLELERRDCGCATE